MRNQCATVADTFGAPRLASFWAEYSGRPPNRADIGPLDTLEANEWVASEAKRVMREVLDVRAMERRHTVTPPVARAQQADERDGDDADAAA